MKNKQIKIWGTIIKDAYFDLEKHPSHLSEVEINLSEFENIVKERLEKLGIKISFCKNCGKKLIFLPTKSGKQMPTRLDLTSHFVDCPNAKNFRKK